MNSKKFGGLPPSVIRRDEKAKSYRETIALLYAEVERLRKLLAGCETDRDTFKQTCPTCGLTLGKEK